MKTMNIILRSTVILVVTFIISIKVNGQASHSDVVSFMEKKGWSVSADNNFSSMVAGEHTRQKYFHFDSGNKYAIVAFSTSKDVTNIDLEAHYENGNDYKKDFNRRLLPKMFKMQYDCAILLFSPEENLRLGIKMNFNSTNLFDSSQCFYIIFYK